MEVRINTRCGNTPKQNKPLVVPNSKPRNPFGLVKKGTVKHKDKRKEDRNNPIE